MAEILGEPVYRIVDEMPAEELMCWSVYMGGEPRGAQRLDWNSAMITSAIYQVMLSFGRSRRTVKVSDCLLKFEREESVRNQTNRLNGVFGGIIDISRAEKLKERRKRFHETRGK